MSSTRSKNSAASSSNISEKSVQGNILRLHQSKNSNNEVFRKYEIIEVIGSGSMGNICRVKLKEGKLGGSAFNPKPKNMFDRIVKRVTKPKETMVDRFPSVHNASDSYVYALKSIHLDRVSPAFLEELENEISILRSMDHPNIVKAYEVFSGKKQIYIVLELCDGGDLYTYAPYTERESARITEQLTSAIRYMHENKIVHRDLKFENIMFETKNRDSAIKVIDFGLSKKFLGKPGMMTERVGTIYTMAPQVLQGVYSSQADLWSIGVMSYMLLSSTKPFYSRRRRKLIDLIMRGRVSFDTPSWGNISDGAKDFCSKLLVVDPKQRMTAAEAMEHPWIVDRLHLPDELPSSKILASIDDSLVHYKQTSQLKKLALTVIAHRSTTKEITELRKVFESLDTSKNGVLTFEEFKASLEKMEYSEEELNEIFSSIDLNQNGHIMYTEFLAATIEAHGYIEEDRVAEAFDRLDCDDTGFISKENLKEALGGDGTPEAIAMIMQVADKNKDNKISYEEFLEAFRSETFKIANQQMEDVGSSSLNSDNLLGLDAKIPGGIYDTSGSGGALRS